MLSSIAYMGLDDIKEFKPNKNTVLISIVSPKNIHPELSGFVEILKIAFEDATPGVKKEDSLLFDSFLAKKTISFIDKYISMEENFEFIVHCEAGISRSAAIATFIASEALLPINGRIAFLNTHVLNVLVKEKYPAYAF